MTVTDSADAVGLALLAFTAWQIAWGVVAFVAVWRDKRLAQAGRSRTPERQLHALEARGGWLGSGLAQLVFRHKTRKETYQRAFRRIILWWGLAWVACLVVAAVVAPGIL